MVEIKKCLERKDGVKMVIIPKNSKIKKGDQVILSNNLNLIAKFIKEESNE